ncbi:cell wall metabolism sensor histidine kinase WalK [Amycolatopsis sp. 195334CR]|uniref:sensor histidine kinase n=1 Tax=Amycolatopsis sp. 195334CR TaxID=2814588 RepID=UPI001A8FEA6D|nr:ATP-binding protein [Amycolatopsis sp. 195334CR]MBN6034869.1 HAMP domain-containing protein [Amycolatopsis sp. 195334CR]
MTGLRLSVRTKLTALYGGLFLLTGVALLLINYLLVSTTLPATQPFATAAVAARGPAVPSDTQVYPTTPTIEVVSTSLDEYRDSTLATLLLQSGIALVIAAALAVLLGWLTASRVLRPVHEVTSAARKLGAENLDRRINLDGPSDELKDLADTFDQMLDRLAGSFDSQRRFVANASHELRTPLAVQRTLIEVALADPDVTPQVRRLGEHLLHTNERSERMIEGLLTLARSDRGLPSRVPVQLAEVASNVVRALAPLAAEHEVEVTTELAERTVAGDPVLLERLATNLVENAIRYNRPGGTVHVRVGRNPALTVQNTGPVIRADAIPALFEPFRRLDHERTSGAKGAGLGLSIVRSVAQAHDGSVYAQPAESGGLVTGVWLPESR